MLAVGPPEQAIQAKLATAVSRERDLRPHKTAPAVPRPNDPSCYGPSVCPAGYQETGCGTISFYDAQGEWLQTRKIARMPEPKKKGLKRQLQTEMDHILRQRPDLRIVTVADGAKDNPKFLCWHHV